MTPDRLSKIRKLVDEGALGAGPVTTDLVRELLADRDRLAAALEVKTPDQSFQNPR